MKQKTPERIRTFLSEQNAFYILDTSGVIELQLGSHDALKNFLENRPQDCLITPSILEEIHTNNGRSKNGHKKMISNEISALSDVVAQYNAHMGRALSTHKLYDTHRWVATSMVYETCCPKKISQDPISIPDGHLMAHALTYAAHRQDIFPNDNRRIFIVTNDEHIRNPLTALRNSVYGPLDSPSDSPQVISNEQMRSFLESYDAIRVPNLQVIVRGKRQ